MTVFHQFESAEQQEGTFNVGMWVFLASEVMFFGGLFCSYFVYRMVYPHAFLVGSQHMNLAVGTINTAVLLTSSLTMALAVHADCQGQARRVPWLLGITCVLGLVFIGIKLYEYLQKFEEHLVPGQSFQLDIPGAQLFFLLYFCMTGLHAIHLSLGCLATGVLTGAARRPLTTAGHLQLDLLALYWHFVDVVWIFLYPLLYLVGHHP